MFQFGKKKRYSIGEKTRYFSSILSNSKESQKRKKWAKLRLDSLKKTKDRMSVGDVFVLNDKVMGNPNRKPRVVVVAKKGATEVSVLGLYKDGKMMSFSKFDGQRMVNFKYPITVRKNALYEKRGFKTAKNAYLTSQEKNRLQKKADEYL